MDQVKIKISPDILFKDMGDEGILLNSQTSSYYRINYIGVKVFKLLLEAKWASFPENLKMLTQECCKETGVPVSQIQKDIYQFMEQLKSAQITQP